jgi:MFS family permease
MADLVPPEQAGKFWSRRTAILNAVMLSSLLFGAFVDLFEPGSLLPFAILFGFGVLVGELDLIIHYPIPEPPMREQPGKLDLLRMLQQPLRDPQFRRFLVWNCAWSFSVTLYSAYVMAYLIEELKLPQFFIGALVSASMLTRFLMARYWGYLADRFGHTAVNTICDFALLVMPLALVFVTPRNCYWLLILVHLWGGTFGIGLDTASTALMLRLSTAENKSMSLAVLYSLVGIIAAAAPPLGGWILQHFEGRQTQFMLWQFDSFQMLFLFGFLLRLLMFPFTLRLDDIGGGSTALVVRRLMDTNPFRVIRHVHVLSDSSAEAERVSAVHELASARSSIATRELVQALNDPSREVRREAAFALARIGDHEAVEPLIQCLRSAESGIQQPAAYALGKLRDPKAVPALLEVLNQPLLSESAASALGELGDHTAIGPLLDLLRQQELPEANRTSVANALSRLGEVAALPDILSALQSTRSALVRQEMALAMGNLLGRPGEFYNLLTRERQVSGQEITRRHEQIVREGSRFRSNPALIQQVLNELDRTHACYTREEWRDACQGYARAGLLLAGSLPVEQSPDGVLHFLSDWFIPHRRRYEEQLAQRDSGSAPLWFLLAIAYPQAQEARTTHTQEESLLAFYAFYRVWVSKTA